MSDKRLRELERRWLETGALIDEALLLRERVRSGSLPPCMLGLAAYCGHGGATAAMEKPPAVPDLEGDWLRGLRPYGTDASARAAILILRAAVAEDSTGRFAQIIDQLEEALVNHDSHKLQFVEREADRLHSQLLETEVAGDDGGWVYGTWHEVAHAISLASRSVIEPELAELVLFHSAVHAPEVMTKGMQTVRTELTSWALAPSRNV